MAGITKAKFVEAAAASMGESLRRSLFRDGALVVFRQLPAMNRLCANGRQLIDQFGGINTVAESLALQHDLCKAFAAQREVDDLFQDVLKEAGVQPQKTFWDRRRMRVQPPSHIQSGHDDVRFYTPHSHSLPFHRDTWGSCLMSQLNWWAPLSELSPSCTLQISPSYFAKPVPNNSARWNYEELKARGGREYPEGQMPVLCPSAVPAVQTDAVPIVIEPGDVLVFSAAHLHSSVINTTPLARFSVEVRTVNLSDVVNNVGAPNVEHSRHFQTQCTSRSPGLQWFAQMVDGSKLSDHTALLSTTCLSS